MNTVRSGRGARRRVLLVVGARPNVPKIAAVQPELAKLEIPTWLLFTGQHNDRLLQLITQDNGLGQPDFHLRIKGGTPVEQYEQIVSSFIKQVDPHREWISCVMVAGDVTSSVACAEATFKLRIPAVHLEAGLRVGKDTPEEINRKRIDREFADLCLTPSEVCNDILRSEGVRAGIVCVGNVMLDPVRKWRQSARYNSSLEEARRLLLQHKIDLRKKGNGYILATFHRPSNVDQKEDLENLVEILTRACDLRPIVLIKHHRLEARLRAEENRYAAYRLSKVSNECGNRLKLIDPVHHHLCLALQKLACCILTDSAGISEEAVYLGKCCVTPRPEGTERPDTLVCGSNWVVNNDPDEVMTALITTVVDPPQGTTWLPPQLWDGYAGRRSARAIRQRYYSEQSTHPIPRIRTATGQ